MTVGIDRNTGQRLTGWALLSAQITDVLTTDVGSRVKRRKYGCKVPRLLGKPLTPGNAARAQVWIVEAFYNSANPLRALCELHSVNLVTDKQGFIAQLHVEANGVRNALAVSINSSNVFGER